MDRSPEKLPRSQAKLQHLDANSNVQSTSHEECATNPSRGQVRPFNSETLLDKNLTSVGCKQAEKLLCRKSGYAVAGLAQCFQVPTPSAAMAMNLHGWPAMASGFHTLDPRSQNAAGNLLYTYGGHHAVMPNLVPVSSSARYNGGSSSKPNNARSNYEKLRSEREVARTESVIKSASDGAEQLKTVSAEHTDKRLEQTTTETPRHNNLSQYPTRELESKTEGGKELHPFIESGPRGLSDAQIAQLKYQHKPAEISTFAPVNGSYRPHGISSSRPEDDTQLHQPPYSLNEPRTAYPRTTVDSFKGYNYRNVDISRQPATNASSSGNAVSTNSSRIPAHARSHSRPGSSGPQVLAASETERSRSPWKQSYSHPVNSETLKTRSEAVYPVRVDQTRESHRFYVEDKSDDFHRRVKVSRGEDFENLNRPDYTQRFAQDCESLYSRHYAYNSSSPVACALPSRSSSENTGITRSQKPRDILSDTSRNAPFDSREILRDPRSKPRETVPSSGRQDSPRGVKDHVTENTNFNVKRLAEQTEKNTSTKVPSSGSKTQGNIRNEKPVLPESLRYKIGGGEGNRCSKSDKVIVYDKEQGMSIGLSVRENSNQNKFEYFSNGRQTTWDAKIEQKDKTSSVSAQGTSDITSRRDAYYGSNVPYRQNKEVKDEKAERTLLEKADNHSAAKSTERGTIGEYNRPEKRSPLEPKAPSISPRDYGKRMSDTNDKNNNSAGIAYRYGNGFYGNVSLPNGEIGRYVPRISSAQERDFRPPNATLEMYERREQELERIGYRKLENVSLPTKQDIQNARKNRELRDDKGQVILRNESNGRPETLAVPYERTKNKEPDSDSSDEDELQIVSEDSDRRSNGGSQSRQTDHRPPPAASQVCTPRTSPSVVERERNGGSVPLSAYNSSMYSNKRPGSESDVSSRDARSEEMMAADPNLWRFGADGKAYQQLMDHYNNMYNAQMIGMQAMPLIAPFSPIMLFPDAGQYIAVNPMEMVDPRLWSLQEAASRDPGMQQYLQHLHLQQLHLQQSKDPFWTHMQQGSHFPWLPFHYYKQFEAEKKEEIENRKSVEEEKHQKQQETANKSERKEPSNPTETTPTSRGEGKDTISRSEDSRLPAYNEQISRSEANAQREEAQRAPDRHPHQQYQDMQESKKQPQNLFTGDSRQSPEQQDSHQQLSEKLQKFQQQLMEKSSYPPPVSTASLSKRDTSSMSLLSVSTSGNLPPLAHTNSCSVSPTTASAAMTLSNLEKNARNDSDLRDEVPGSNRDTGDVENRPSIETRGLATENESTRGGSDSLRGDVAAGEKAESTNVSEGTARRRDCYASSVYNTGMDALGRVAAECSLMEQSEKQSRDSESRNLDIKLERTGSFDDHKPHGGFVSDEDDQESNDEYEISPQTPDHDKRLFAFDNQEIENQKKISLSSAGSLDVWRQLKEVRDGLSNIKSERTSRFIDTETKNRPEFDGIMERFAKNRAFKDERVYETKYEYKSFAPVMLPCRKDMFLAEKENILKQEKIEEERKKIRENINRCRLLAKRRNSKERFTVLSHRRDTRSPTTILNSVTSSISDMIENNTEKEMRMKLAELQKRYRERMRELSRLQPKFKDGNDDGSGKNQPKRGPGRPRKRKYFGGGTKYSARPSSAASNGSEFSACAFEESLNGPQNLQLWRADSDESLHSRDVEPVKKKKKKTKGQNKDLSPTKAQNPTLTDCEEMPVKVKLTKKITVGTNKATPPCKKPSSVPAPAVNEDGSGSEQEVTSLVGLEADKKKSKSKNEKKIKKRGRPKTDIELSSTNIAPESSSSHGDTTQPQSPIKLQKTKKVKKKKKKLASLSALTSPETDLKSETRAAHICKVAVQTLVAKETDIMATEVPIIRFKNSDDLSDEAENDEVFEANQDDEDGLNLLAAFAAEVKPAKRQRERAGTPSSEHSAVSPSKRRGRPKKPTRPSSSESETPTTTRKRVRKLSSKKATSPLPLKVVSPLTVLPVREASPENKVAIPLPEVEDISEPESETKPEPEGEKDENLEEKIHNEEKVLESRDLTQETTRKGRRKSGTCTPKETESSFPLLADELWQRRRSERIFLNSSSVESPSPLSSPSAAFSFGAVAKKQKKSSKLKKEKSVSLSSLQSENETPEALSDTFKQKTKPKRRKSLGNKGKKKRRISSSATVESEEEGEEFSDVNKEEETTRGFVEISEAEMELEQPVVSQEGDGSIGFVKPEVEQPTRSESFEQSTPVETMENETEQETCNEKVATALKEEEETSGDKHEIEEMVGSEKMVNKAESIEKEINEENKEDKNLPDSVVASSMEDQKTPNRAVCEPIDRAETAKTADDDNSEPNPEPVFTFTCEELVQGTKVILPSDGVFYRGLISIIQEPDLYGVVLAGERGRRPHWRATDQLLTQAVKDVVPTSKEFLSVGTRVCAHWSPQYRCFYPGTVTEAPEDEKEQAGKVWIEFDDGDSGIFPFCEVRRILSGRPVEDAESSPAVVSIEPKKRTRASCNSSRTNTKQGCIASESNSCSDSSGDEETKMTKTQSKQNNKRQTKKNETQSSSEVNEDNVKTGVGGLDSDSESEKRTISKKEALKLRKKEPNSRSRENMSNKDFEESKSDSELNSVATARHSKRKMEKSPRDLNRLSRKRTLKERSKLASGCNDSSDQVDESTSDGENLMESKVVRTKDSSKYSDLDLRKKSLTLSLSSSTRSGAFNSRVSGGESPRAEPEDDSESYSDTFDESPLVESKRFQPRLPRRRRSELDRLQMDLKSSGQLWQWSGRSSQKKRRGKGRKVFYKAISRADETICIGDCAVFMSSPSKSNNLPYVGKIENMWEGCSGCMMVRVKWFYHPEETKKGRRPADAKAALYLSPHVDENDIQTISHRCEVLSQEDYKRRMQTLENANTRSSSRTDRLFCCIGKYDPTSECFQTD